MIRNAQKLILGLTIVILVLSGVTGAFSQTTYSPLSNYVYKADYARYESIKKEADLQKRADLLLAFAKERAVSQLLLNSATDYMECVKPELDKKDWAKAISMQEAFLAILPTEKAAQDAVAQAQGTPESAQEYINKHLIPTQKLLTAGLLQANLQSKNLPKAAEMGEKLYAMNPDKSILQLVAGIYFDMKNYDKYLECGKKIMADTPMDQGYATALQMAQVYIQKQDIAAATELYTKVLEAYGEKVPPNVQEAQWNPTRAFAYGILASQAYAKKDYPAALDLFGKVVKYDPKNGDAYYYIGMAKWQTKDQDGAIEPFAKCVVLGKSLAPKAQGYLETLWKPKHNNTLDGLEELKAKVKAELGI